jgi:L-amino acid N-acyltransferase YncA
MTLRSADSSRVRPAVPKDAAPCLDIYAPIVRETPTSFETQLQTVEEFAGWIRETMRDYPWLVAGFPCFGADLRWSRGRSPLG